MQIFEIDEIKRRVTLAWSDGNQVVLAAGVFPEEVKLEDGRMHDPFESPEVLAEYLEGLDRRHMVNQGKIKKPDPGKEKCDKKRVEDALAARAAKTSVVVEEPKEP